MTHLVLGCGFTGARVARLLAATGERVLASVGPAGSERAATDAGAVAVPLEADDAASRAALARRCAGEGGALRVLVAIPPAPLPGGGERTAALLAALGGQVARVVLLSSTVVYGGAVQVDEATPALATGDRARRYLDAERAVREGPWSSLVLRPAAIYGPGRGLLAEGGPRFGHARSLDAIVSRIHVDDLAAIAAAGLRSDVAGTFPVADEEPASGRALLAAWSGAAWSSPAGAPDAAGSRRVDGRAIVRALGLRLRYPAYRDAIG